MELGHTLAEALRERGLRRDALVQATRYYLAERLQDPPAEDLLVDLEEQVTDGADLSAEVARNPLLLQEVALGVLSAAWERPDERPRVERALDDAGGKLPAADLLPVAITLVYGLYLAAKTGSRFETTTSMTRDGTYVTRTVQERGALAILLGAMRVWPATQAPTSVGAALLPGEGSFSVLLLDIQESSEMAQVDRSRAAAALRSLVEASLGDLSVRTPDVIVNDRGDGFQMLVPEPAGALTPLVARLPGLVRKRLTNVPGPPLQVRMGIHTGRLRHEHQWTGDALVHLARITDAKEIKDRLRASGKRLATVLSERVHLETIHEGYVEPTYERMLIHCKETTAWVWLMLS